MSTGFSFVRVMSFAFLCVFLTLFFTGEVQAAGTPDPTWSLDATDFEIWQSSSLTWDAGTLVCTANLTDTDTDTINCSSGTIDPSTSYRVQIVAGNTGDSADFKITSSVGYVNQYNVKAGWAGTSPTLGTCGFNDFGADNQNKVGGTVCSVSWSSNTVSMTNTSSDQLKISKTNGTEGFMYTITTDTNPTTTSNSYLDMSDTNISEISSKITITATVPPTVTAQNASSVEATTATGNGNITATGGASADTRGFVYDTSSHGQPGNVAPGSSGYASFASDSGSYGTGAYTKGLTSLSSGTTYYIRAYAHNVAGYSYSSSEVSTITKPAAPTSVSATDGTYTDKVTITWTKSTGATDYHVWRDSTDLGSAGDVATFDDTGANAPTVTPGTASATNGSATDKVTLSISGASANNGTTHTYKVIASNSSGNSADSSTDTGYRGVGALTYQWSRSSGDADSGFTSLTDATTTSFNDTSAPAPTITSGSVSASDGTDPVHVALSISGQSANEGSGRYYYATVSATGTTPQDTNHDRGYIGVGSLTYQWQRSAADSDSGYSNISGATTASYNDTDAPANTDGRYYQCVLNATGAISQTSSSDRGFKQPVYSITIISGGPITYGFVEIGNSTSTVSQGYTQTVENDGTVPIDLNVKSSNATGGTTWTLATSIGSNIFKHEFSTTSGSTWAALPDSSTYVLAVSSLTVSSTVDVDFRLTVPSDTTDYYEKSTTITFQAVAP